MDDHDTLTEEFKRLFDNFVYVTVIVTIEQVDRVEDDLEGGGTNFIKDFFYSPRCRALQGVWSDNVYTSSNDLW